MGRALVDVDEVQKCFQQVLVVEVPVPPLRGLTVGVHRLRNRVPNVDVLEFRPETEIGIGDVEHSVGHACCKPGIILAEFDAVAVQSHDESLPARTRSASRSPASPVSVSAANLRACSSIADQFVARQTTPRRGRPSIRQSRVPRRSSAEHHRARGPLSRSAFGLPGSTAHDRGARTSRARRASREPSRRGSPSQRNASSSGARA